MPSLFQATQTRLWFWFWFISTQTGHINTLFAQTLSLVWLGHPSKHVENKHLFQRAIAQRPNFQSLKRPKLALAHQDGSEDTRLRTIGPITRDPPCKSQNPATKSHTFWSRRPPRDPNLSWFGLFRPVFVRGGAGQPDLSIPASGEISGISQGRAEATISYIRLYFLLSLTELGLSLFL